MNEENKKVSIRGEAGQRATQKRNRAEKQQKGRENLTQRGSSEGEFQLKKQRSSLRGAPSTKERRRDFENIEKLRERGAKQRRIRFSL